MSWQDSTSFPIPWLIRGGWEEQLIRDTNSFLLFLGKSLYSTYKRKESWGKGRGEEARSRGRRAMALGLCPCQPGVSTPTPALQARKAIRGACCEGAGMIPEPQLPGSPKNLDIYSKPLVWKNPCPFLALERASTTHLFSLKSTFVTTTGLAASLLWLPWNFKIHQRLRIFFYCPGF